MWKLFQERPCWHCRMSSFYNGWPNGTAISVDWEVRRNINAEGAWVSTVMDAQLALVCQLCQIKSWSSFQFYSGAIDHACNELPNMAYQSPYNQGSSWFPNGLKSGKNKNLYYFAFSSLTCPDIYLLVLTDKKIYSQLVGFKLHVFFVTL